MSTTERNTEEAILKAAEAEFMEKGLAGARTVSIAEKAGVTHAMLHYYFRTKDQLFERIAKEKVDELVSSVLSIFEDSSLPIGERIEKGMSAHFDFLTRNPYLPSFIVKEIDHVNLDVIKPYLPKVMGVVASIDKELGQEINPINILIDIVSQNIFPFLLVPAADKFGVEESQRTAILEAIKKENIYIIKKRLGLCE